MKKLMTVMLGLSLAFGSATATLAQDETPKKESKKGSKKGKKDGDSKGDEKKDEKK